MKKIIALLLALVMVLALCACGGKTEAPKTEEPKTEEPKTEAPKTEEPKTEEPKAEQVDYNTVTPGKLTVATSPDFAPYEFYAIDKDGNPQLAGFDIAIAAYIADYLGLELEIIPMDFDGVLLELAAGNVDIGLAGLSPDPDRMDAMDFSDIYYLGGQAFVTVKDKAGVITSMEVANDPQYQVGAQNGSIQFDLANENTPNAEIVPLTKVTDIIGELINDKLDAAFIETAVAENYAKNYPELTIVCDVPYDVAGSAVGVKKGNDVLMGGINEAIAAALADGSMDQFVAEANELSTGEIILGLLDQK